MDFNWKAVKTIGKHKIEGGLDFQYTHMYEAGSSFQFAHTVQPAPERVLKDGLDCWSFNRNSSYFDATRTFAALYVLDNWRPTERLLVKSGLRFKPFIKNVDSAARLEGETINTRVEGFNLANPTMAKLHKFDDPGIDYAASEHIMCRIYGNLYAFAEGFYSMTNKGITYFKNATIPSLKPIGIALARGGLWFNNKHFDATLLGFYITTWNKAAALTVTKQIAGTSETIPWYAEYGIGTPGVTFDGSCHFGGFNLHVNAT